MSDYDADMRGACEYELMQAKDEIKRLIDENKRLNELLIPMRHYLKTLHEERAVDDVAMKFRSYKPLAECLVIWEIDT